MAPVIVLLLWLSISAKALVLLGNLEALLCIEGRVTHNYIIDSIDFSDGTSRLSFLQLLSINRREFPDTFKWHDRQLSDRLCRELVRHFDPTPWLHGLVFPFQVVQRHSILYTSIDMEQYFPDIITVDDSLGDIPTSLEAVIQRVFDNPRLCGSRITARIASKYSPLWETIISGSTGVSSRPPRPTNESLSNDEVTNLRLVMEHISFFYHDRTRRQRITDHYFELKSCIINSRLNRGFKLFSVLFLLVHVAKLKDFFSCKFIWGELGALVQQDNNLQHLCPWLVRELFISMETGEGKFCPPDHEILSALHPFLEEIADSIPRLWPRQYFTTLNAWALKFRSSPSQLLLPPGELDFESIVTNLSKFESIENSIYFDDQYVSWPVIIRRLDGIKVRCNSIPEFLMVVSEMVTEESNLASIYAEYIVTISQPDRFRDVDLRFLTRLLLANLIFLGCFSLGPKVSLQREIAFLSIQQHAYLSSSFQKVGILDFLSLEQLEKLDSRLFRPVAAPRRWSSPSQAMFFIARALRGSEWIFAFSLLSLAVFFLLVDLMTMI